MENHTDDELWEFIKGRVTLKDIEVIGVDYAWSMAMGLANVAYKELVRRGKISADEIFSPSYITRSGEWAGKDAHGDIGWKGDEIWIFQHSEWKKFK